MSANTRGETTRLRNARTPSASHRAGPRSGVPAPATPSSCTSPEKVSSGAPISPRAPKKPPTPRRSGPRRSPRCCKFSSRTSGRSRGQSRTSSPKMATNPPSASTATPSRAASSPSPRAASRTFLDGQALTVRLWIGGRTTSRHRSSRQGKLRLVLSIPGVCPRRPARPKEPNGSVRSVRPGSTPSWRAANGWRYGPGRK